ncbi:hypothetical protein BP5796_12391 [Coleophoma crateriformis]|uniref:Uncharacterized protein n=1 Tax=Coleophoma crateriformis TaxID=565419 RepID=A0A3D8Q9K2_9HELO|nr:hypothetical protein BP5796_12391 [Coleophoma crateriformis]
MDPIALFRTYPTVASLSILLVSYVALGTIKRLYFSPISHFPGPKLAAITFWYQYYFNHILRGKYTYEIERLHREYGPIVRINPHELHIDDTTFYDTLYGGPGTVRDKWEKDSVAGLKDSIFSTMPHDLHKLRRAAIAPYFSLQSARRLQPVIQKAANSVIETLQSRQNSSSVVDATEIFAAYSNDVVMEYSFGRSESRLTSQGYDIKYFSESVKAGATAQGLKYFPWFTRIMFSMPEAVLALDPTFASFASQRKQAPGRREEPLAPSRRSASHHWRWHDHHRLEHRRRGVLPSLAPSGAPQAQARARGRDPRPRDRCAALHARTAAVSHRGDQGDAATLQRRHGAEPADRAPRSLAVPRVDDPRGDAHVNVRARHPLRREGVPRRAGVQARAVDGESEAQSVPGGVLEGIAGVSGAELGICGDVRDSGGHISEVWLRGCEKAWGCGGIAAV